MLSFYWPFIKQLFSIAKKALLVIVVFVAIISLFFYFITKDQLKITQNPQDSIQKNRIQIYKIINDPQLSQTKEGKITIAIYRGIMCGLIGETCTTNPADAEKNYHQSLFGFMTNLIVLPYSNPPASGIYWAFSGLQNAGFIPKSYAAQGVGFGAIKPLSNLWILFRDITYMFLVIVLIIIGFMIMFRMKLNPQTVISVENALPKIVIALLLITFSFAIAGFLIDLMYVMIALSISLLSKNTYYHIDVQTYQNNFIAGDSWFLFDRIANVWGVGDALFSFVPAEIGIVIKSLVMLIVFWLLAKIPVLEQIITGKIAEKTAESGNIIQTIIEIPMLPVRAGIAVVLGLIFSPLIISLFVWLTALLIFFRIFFMLFKAYIEIILLIIFSPIILLFEAIPGKGTFSFWLKYLIADLIVFPIVVIITIVGRIIIYIPTSGANLWIAPFMPNVDAHSFSVLVGVGIMFMIPEIVKMVKELMGVKGLPLNLGIGTFFAGAGAGVGGSIGMLSQFGSLSLAVPGLRRGASTLPFIGDFLKTDDMKLKPQGAGGKTGDETKTK